ncbi:MAG: phosphatidylglycerophosphatase A [Alphaproteobacteria bacterium]
MSDNAPDTDAAPSLPPPPTPPKGLPNWHPAYLISTAFGIGHLPKAPGTWASAITLPFALGIYYLGGPPVLLLFVVYLFCIGWWSAQVYVKRRMAQDPAEIVVDEIAAQLLVFVFAPPTWYNLIIGFLLFRAFDIWKPWPIRWADRVIGGGFGVMFDDILAALYAGGLLWLINSIIAANAAAPAVMP